MKYPIGNYFKCYFGIFVHKVLVFYYCLKFCFVLIKRGIVHDFSKYRKCELDGFLKVVHKLKDSQYGSEEYFDLIKEIKPNIEEHYKVNPHHPEYYGEKGISGMNMHDLIEMWCDWQAAVKKHRDGNILNSVNHNEKRFEMPPQLAEIMRNSIK